MSDQHASLVRLLHDYGVESFEPNVIALLLQVQYGIARDFIREAKELAKRTRGSTDLTEMDVKASLGSEMISTWSQEIMEEAGKVNMVPFPSLTAMDGLPKREMWRSWVDGMHSMNWKTTMNDGGMEDRGRAEMGSNHAPTNVDTPMDPPLARINSKKRILVNLPVQSEGLRGVGNEDDTDSKRVKIEE